MAEQKFNVRLSFRDEATGKFIKAGKDQIAAIQKTGVAVKKVGKGMALNMDRAARSTKRAGNEIDRMRIKTSGLRRVIGGLRNALLVYFFAMRPFLRYGKEVIQLAVAQEIAETKLKLALKGSGLATKEQTEEVIKYAKELQTLTVYGDEQIINAQAMLATFQLNSEEIKKITPRILDMARGLTKLNGKQQDLQTIAIAVGKGLTGQVGILSKYGVTISEAAKRSGDMNKILSEMDRNYKGMAIAQMNYSDQTVVMSNVVGDFKEAIGETIIKSEVVLAIIGQLTKSFLDMTKAVNKIAERTNNFEKSLIGILKYLIALRGICQTLWRLIIAGFQSIYVVGIKVWEGLTDAIGFFQKMLGEIIKFLSENLAKFYDLLGKLPGKLGQPYREAAEAVRGFGDNSQEVFDELSEDFKQMSKDAKEYADSLATHLRPGMDIINEGIDNTVSAYGDLLGAIDRVKNAQSESYNKLKATTERWKEFLEDLTKATEKTAKAMEKGFSDFFFDAMAGELKTLEDYFKAFGRSVLRILSDIIAKQTMLSLFGGLFGGGTTPGDTVTSVGPILGHSGGVIGRRNYDSGGVVNANLLSGEGVLNRRGLRGLGTDNLNKLNEGRPLEGGGAAPIVIIHAWDASDIRRNEAAIVSLISKAISSNSPLRGVIRQYA